MTNNLAGCREAFEAWHNEYHMTINSDYDIWQAAYSARPTPVITDEMVNVAALAMQKDFPVVSHGANERGDWCINPLELAIFERSAKAALTAALPHAVDAAGVYNQAVEDAAVFLETRVLTYGGGEPYLGMNRKDTRCSTMSFLASQLRALKNPITTAPDAAAIRKAALMEAAEKLSSEGLDNICECIGAPKEYNDGKTAMLNWATGRLRALAEKEVG